MNLLHRIFHGDFCPADGIEYSEAYKKQKRETFFAYQAFYETLDREQKERLEEFLELDTELSGMAQEEHYIEGTKIGILLMLEVLRFDKQ